MFKKLFFALFILIALLTSKVNAACTVTGGGTICAGSTITLTYNTSGSAPGGITWQYSANGTSGWANVVNSTPSGISYTGTTTTSLTISTISTATAGTYFYRASNATGTNCGAPYSAAAVSITVVSPPTTANAGSDIVQTCTTTSTLAGNTPTSGTGTWTLISGIATIITPTSPTSGITGLVVGASATFRWTITNSPCTSSSDDVIITVNSGAGCLTYCASNATNTTDEEILNVTFGTLNNTSTCATTGGSGSTLNEYSNYTGVSAPNITQSATVPFSIQIGTCDGNYTNAVKIFIDYNQDGDFVDAGEEVYVSATSTTGAHTETGSIVIPAGASVGNTRMRIVNVETGTPATITACGTYSWGETEDYTINIVTDGPMTYFSCTTTQTVTSDVMRCNTNQQIIGVEIVTTGSSSPLVLSELQINMNGSTIPGTNTNDVTKIHVYYTGSSTTFSPVGAFDGIGTNVSTGTITISGSQTLATGTNYFWIAYDINSVSATIGDILDVQCTQLKVSTVDHVPTVTSPMGSRSIIICNPSPGGVLTGLETWLRADIGIVGSTPITGWSNQKSTGTPIVVNGSPNLITSSISYNYNPYIDFTAPAGVLADGAATNRQFLKLSGYDGLAGINYTSLFYAFQLTDLTRINTHIATVDNVTFGIPVNGTLHGDVDATNTIAAIQQDSYDISDFGTGSSVGTWQRNALNIASNSNHTSEKQLLTANCNTGGSTTLNRFLGGQRDAVIQPGFIGHPRDWKGPVAEIIGYTNSLTATERQKIHSYLSIKYGMTLTSNYLSTSSATIFTTASPYNNNIIGIGRDDNEALTQRQSHNDDDTVRIYLNTLASSNSLNTGTFGNNISYIMTGATTGKMCSTLASLGEMPVACDLYSRLEREWKVTKTNVTENLSMDFKLATCSNPATVNIADLRFLVDDDGNFANGGTTCYANGDGSGIVISYSNPLITVSTISMTHIPNNSTRYVTIGSANVATPLPIELLYFDAKPNDNNRTVDLTWTTATEINNDYFIVEKRTDTDNWKDLSTVDGAGNSTGILNYSTIDYNPIFGNNYYRLKQVDFNGVQSYSDMRVVSINASNEIIIYPNPANTSFTIQVKNLAINKITVSDALGKIVSLPVITSSEEIEEYSTVGLSNGIYFIELHTGNERNISKLIIQKKD
ncbi:MAG: T9SS type A sorting domain-containing protein [Flavobacteriia bacterium]|nr:T9SS type A sorting domain-containing protein [Flavobacteriia bacterium]